MHEDILENVVCFPTVVYHVNKPVFFERVRNAAINALSNQLEGVNEIYPVKMTADLSQDPTIQDFCEYTAKSSLNILKDQGYDVTNKAAYFESMWCQEHHKHSMMEQHVHPGDVQIVGFYFLDTPDGCSMATFHDPRAGKVQNGRAESKMAEVTYASNAFLLKPEPGQLVLTNAWLPHSFTRQHSDKPFRFIHFNICLTDNLPTPQFKPADEVV